MTSEYSQAAPDKEINQQVVLPSLARLSILWLASNLFWSAVMSQVLAERVEFFAGDKKGLYLAVIGASGAIMSTLIQLVIGPLSDNSTHRKGRRYIFVVAGSTPQHDSDFPLRVFRNRSCSYWSLSS